MINDTDKYSVLIKKKAQELGFSACGISRAVFLEDEARRLEKWLKNGNHGTMQYMENYFDKRVDPRRLVEGAETVISVLHNYFPLAKQEDPEAPVLSKYAWGTDYHFVMKDKLRKLLEFINELVGEVNGRVFVDSAPVLDRAWAARSGLGWIGKNTCLLVRGSGSFYFIGELIIDLNLPSDKPIKDYCGTCRRCIDACPTGAIEAPRVLNARKCISYLTIEYRNELPAGMQDRMENRVFGCDICQDVCPWNKKALPHNEPLLDPDARVMNMDEGDWHGMDRQLFNLYFRNSAIKRGGYAQLKRNLRFLKHQGG
ncbi:MAG: tRNA epoxyqueuosine(34) reductase QueG [Bacteroidales bacterium]